MSDGGKGDSPRPLSVSHQTFSDNWDLIFKKPVVTSTDNPVLLEDKDENDICIRPGQDAS